MTDTVTTQVKVLNGAPNPTGAASNFGSQCLTDSFSVTNPGKLQNYSPLSRTFVDFSQRNPGGTAPPVICGTNTGKHSKHVYVSKGEAFKDLTNLFSVRRHLSRVQRPSLPTGSRRDHRQIVVYKGSLLNLKVDELVANYGYYSQISQYNCNYENLAPDGCTEYHFGSATGAVTTYNYNGGTGQHLANQLQTICVRYRIRKGRNIVSFFQNLSTFCRRERTNCRICWAATSPADFAVSGDLSTMS